MEKIILYSNNCPKCEVLEDKLNEKNIEFEIVNDMEVLKSLNFDKLPVLKIDDDEYLDFSNANKWINSQKGC